MSEYATPRDAASVILVRARSGSGDAEVFLLRRHRKASFMSSAYVFPGGAADPGEDDPRVTAARELFEEAGVLLCRQPVEAERLADWRHRLHEGTATLADLLAGHGAELDLDALTYYAHWITPSVERKRFSARFFVAELPAGQVPSFDNRETVDEVWVTPAEALERAGDLKLPPPQVRTFADMLGAGGAGVTAVVADARSRAGHRHPILPRMFQLAAGFALLLPWDPDYHRATGAAHAMAPDHPLARGPSRFVLEDGTWKNVSAPDSTTAG